jgi:putative NADPH-quinone reductase
LRHIKAAKREGSYCHADPSARQGTTRVRKICIIQGHPTPGDKHFGQALARAYAQAAAAAGHEVETIQVADLEFPILRSKLDWDAGEVPAVIGKAQAAIGWAQHLLIIHPLWMGSMPALLKAFFEQALRPGFALSTSDGARWSKRLTGRSARVVVTMGMPGFVYRWYFGAHGLKSLTQTLALVGIAPCRTTVIGSIEAMTDRQRRKWLDHLAALGRRAA